MLYNPIVNSRQIEKPISNTGNPPSKGKAIVGAIGIFIITIPAAVFLIMLLSVGAVGISGPAQFSTPAETIIPQMLLAVIILSIPIPALLFLVNVFPKMKSIIIANSIIVGIVILGFLATLVYVEGPSALLSIPKFLVF